MGVSEGPGRREVLRGLGAAALAPAVARAGSPPALRPRIRPGDPAWPSDAAWARLGEAVGGRLSKVELPTLDPANANELLHNPFWLRDQAALTQAAGWTDAWNSTPSLWAVRAENAEDVAASVRFAAAHNLRLVIKGGGHSYVGGCCAADSLLIWTRGMDGIEMHEVFTPEGGDGPGVPAVSLGSGCIWLHAYQTVSGGHGRYVQGGGCTTVGVAGLVQGGGFGSYSKGFGLAAASLIEAELVTADGAIRVVNAHREPDLFWALKGGGGGAFGVATRLTLRTHDLPEGFGIAQWTVKAQSEVAFRDLIEAFFTAYAERLCNPHWGEQVMFTPDRRMVVRMSCQGLTRDEAQAAWSELIAFSSARQGDFKIIEPLLVAVVPARRQWDEALLAAVAPHAISRDTRPGASPTDYWWTGDGEQPWITLHGYQSAWLPSHLLSPGARDTLCDALVRASRHWSVGLHFNKGLFGATPQTLAAAADSAINPQLLDAFALAIIAGGGASPLPGHPTPPQMIELARKEEGRIRAAMAELKACAPKAGSYMSECAFDLTDWKRAQWGDNAPRLEAIKRRYDPHGLFIIHHGVGSDAWSADGFTPLA